MLRILYSRLGEPHIGPPTAYSFNVPTRKASGVMSTDKGGRVEKSVVKGAVYLGGMCPRCEGMGQVNDIDRTALYDDSKSLRDGALTVPGYSMDGWYGRLFEGMGLPMDTPIASFTAKQLDTMLYAPPTKIKVEGVNLTFEGIVPRIQKSMLSKDPEAMQPHVRRFVERDADPGLGGDEDRAVRLDRQALLRQRLVDRRLGDAVFLEQRVGDDGVAVQRRGLDDPALPGVRHRLLALRTSQLGDPQRLSPGARARCTDHLVQARPVHVSHGEIRRAVDLVRVVDRDHVRMVERRCEP
jgi:hypothetical protein